MKTRTRYTLALIAFLLTVRLESSAQLSIAEFLQSAKGDFGLKTVEDQMQFLDGRTYRLAPLQKLEFRTRNNYLDPSRQDYGLRFTPANPWEVKHNNRYFLQYKNVLSFEKSLALKDALMVRYNYVAELLYYKAIKTLKEETQRLINAQVSILEKQQNSDFFGGEDYIELKLDQMDKTVELEESAFALDNQVRKLPGLYPSGGQKRIDWHYEQVLSVDRIEKITDSIFMIGAVPVTVTYRENQIDLANQEYLLEKSNFNMGFIQTQYESYRTEQDRKPWTISLGVTIPVFNPNKGDMAKRKMDAIEAQNDRDEAKVVSESSKNVSYEQLKSLVQRYRDIQKKIQALNVGTLSNTLNALKFDNPIATIRFQENVLKLKAIELKLKQSIVVTYIEFLGHTDAIQQQPLVNFLSPDLEHIEL